MEAMNVDLSAHVNILTDIYEQNECAIVRLKKENEELRVDNSGRQELICMLDDLYSEVDSLRSINSSKEIQISKRFNEIQCLKKAITIKEEEIEEVRCDRKVLSADLEGAHKRLRYGAHRLEQKNEQFNQLSSTRQGQTPSNICSSSRITSSEF